MPSPPLPTGPNQFLSVHTSQLNLGKGSRGTTLRFRLRGLRDDRTEVASHDAYFPPLEPGSYTFEACRDLGRPLTVAILDVDHFKRINDTRGLLAGDEVLLVMPGAAQQRPLLPLERLQRSIAEMPFTYAGASIPVTASFGAAWLCDRSDTAEAPLRRADAALYLAKQAGRKRVEYAATG